MSRSAEKIERGDSLVSPGMVCYAEKQVKPFWSNSLGQMVQFDTIIFCRTFKNYFGQFVWIEKKSHYNSRVSLLHEAPTKNTFQLANIIGLKSRRYKPLQYKYVASILLRSNVNSPISDQHLFIQGCIFSKARFLAASRGSDDLNIDILELFT